MANTRKRQPTRPTKQAPEVEEFDSFDEMMGDALSDVPPLMLPVPRWDPETDERILPDEKLPIACPTGRDMEDWSIAVKAGEDYNAYIALFGEDIGERFWRGTEGWPFFKRANLMGRVLVHYQLQGADGLGINPQS